MYWHPVISFEASTGIMSFRNRITCSTNLLHLNQILLIIRSLPCLPSGGNDDVEYSMEYSPSSKADSFSLSQKTHKILWKPQVHHQGHISPPLVRILSQINPVHPFHPVSSRYGLISSFHLPLGPPSGLFPAV